MEVFNYVSVNLYYLILEVTCVLYLLVSNSVPLLQCGNHDKKA